jgi:hypothetical protein
LIEEDKKSDQELAAEADKGLRGQGATVEMMRRLKDVITHLDASSSIQQKKMLKLTRWIMFLTWVMALVAIIQLVTLFKSQLFFLF